MCYSLSALIKIGRYHGVPCQVTLATLLPCTPLHIEKFTTARVAKSPLFSLGNIHKGRPTIMGHFGHTYLPMSGVFYTMPITLVRFLLRYLPTPKSDVLYERSKMRKYQNIKQLELVTSEMVLMRYFIPYSVNTNVF